MSDSESTLDSLDYEELQESNIALSRDLDYEREKSIALSRDLHFERENSKSLAASLDKARRKWADYKNKYLTLLEKATKDAEVLEANQPIIEATKLMMRVETNKATEKLVSDKEKVEKQNEKLEICRQKAEAENNKLNQQLLQANRRIKAYEDKGTSGAVEPPLPQAAVLPPQNTRSNNSAD